MAKKKLYIWCVCVQKQEIGVVTTSMAQGYTNTASNEDEVRGIAYKRAMELKPGMQVIDILVLEVKELS